MCSRFSATSQAFKHEGIFIPGSVCYTQVRLFFAFLGGSKVSIGVCHVWLYWGYLVAILWAFWLMDTHAHSMEVALWVGGSEGLRFKDLELICHLVRRADMLRLESEPFPQQPLRNYNVLACGYDPVKDTACSLVS